MSCRKLWGAVQAGHSGVMCTTRAAAPAARCQHLAAQHQAWRSSPAPPAHPPARSELWRRVEHRRAGRCHGRFVPAAGAPAGAGGRARARWGRSWRGGHCCRPAPDARAAARPASRLDCAPVSPRPSLHRRTARIRRTTTSPSRMASSRSWRAWDLGGWREVGRTSSRGWGTPLQRWPHSSPPTVRRSACCPAAPWLPRRCSTAGRSAGTPRRALPGRSASPEPWAGALAAALARPQRARLHPGACRCSELALQGPPPAHCGARPLHHHTPLPPATSPSSLSHTLALATCPPSRYTWFDPFMPQRNRSGHEEPSPRWAYHNHRRGRGGRVAGGTRDRREGVPTAHPPAAVSTPSVQTCRPGPAHSVRHVTGSASCTRVPPCLPACSREHPESTDLQTQGERLTLEQHVRRACSAARACLWPLLHAAAAWPRLRTAITAATTRKVVIVPSPPLPTCLSLPPSLPPSPAQPVQVCAQRGWLWVQVRLGQGQAPPQWAQTGQAGSPAHAAALRLRRRARRLRRLLAHFASPLPPTAIGRAQQSATEADGRWHGA